MAIYHMQAKVVSRGSGRSAVAASAYMSCSRMYSVILPVRIWYFSLHRELIRGKRQWSTRDLITDTAKAVSAAWMSVQLTLW